MGVAATAVAAAHVAAAHVVAGVHVAAGAQRDLAISNAAATGLIFGLGVGGSFVVVLALTIRAARQSNRAYAAAAGRARAARKRAGGTGRTGRDRTRAAHPHGGADVQTGGHDPYPRQPYSAHEPKSHQPYSRPYRVPAQDDQHSRAQTNGHGPGPVGTPSTPWSPTED